MIDTINVIWLRFFLGVAIGWTIRGILACLHNRKIEKAIDDLEDAINAADERTRNGPV